MTVTARKRVATIWASKIRNVAASKYHQKFNITR